MYDNIVVLLKDNKFVELVGLHGYSKLVLVDLHTS